MAYWSILQAAEGLYGPEDVAQEQLALRVVEMHLSREHPPGDCESNGTVDADGLAEWEAAIGPTVAREGDDADGNYDGVVNGQGFLDWQQQLGSMGLPIHGSAAAQAVLEPSSAVLALMVVGLLASGRHRQLHRSATLGYVEA